MYDLIEEGAKNKIVVKSDLLVILAEIVTDMSISANALRIYCYMANRIGSWQFTNNEIKEVLNIKSDHSISKYIKELIDGGYLSRTEIRNNGVFGGYSYQLTICQKMTIGKNGNKNKNELNFQQNDHMSKNDNRLADKEEKKKSNIKEKKEEYFILNNINNNNNNNNNNLKEKNIKKENTFFQAKNEIDLEFVRFLDYRKQIKKPYKNINSINAIHKKFVGWCNGSVEVAKQIVDKTIENQWQGLFEIQHKNQKQRFSFVGSSKINNYDVGIKA